MRATRRIPAGYAPGFTLLEVTLSLAILLAASVLLTQFLVAANRQRQVGDQRRLALEELSNRMEQVLAAKWESLSAAEIEKQELSPLVLERLPAAKLTATVAAETDPVEARRIRLEISWEQRGDRVAPIRLTAWRYRRQEAQP